MESLSTHTGPGWTIQDGVATIGSAFDTASGQWDYLATAAAGTASVDSLAQLARCLSGFFAIVR